MDAIALLAARHHEIRLVRHALLLTLLTAVSSARQAHAGIEDTDLTAFIGVRHHLGEAYPWGFELRALGSVFIGRSRCTDAGAFLDGCDGFESIHLRLGSELGLEWRGSLRFAFQPGLVTGASSIDRLAETCYGSPDTFWDALATASLSIPIGTWKPSHEFGLRLGKSILGPWAVPTPEPGGHVVSRGDSFTRPYLGMGFVFEEEERHTAFEGGWALPLLAQGCYH